MIGDEFSKYSQYSVYKIDIEDNKVLENSNIKYKWISKYSSHEEYEKFCPSFKTYFSNINKNKTEDVLFVCVGSNEITGCSLRLLETIKDRNISLLYIRPDLIFLNDKNKLQEKITYNIFQEYARSGLLKDIYLFDNQIMEKHILELSISSYYKKLNELIVSTFHFINVFKHTQPLWEINNDELPSGTRIKTVGIFEQNHNIEKYLFPIKYITHKIFYYAFSKKQIDSDRNTYYKD